MQFSLHQDFSEITAEAWNGLAAESISDTPFARREYLSQWWSTLGGGEWTQADLVLVSASDAGRLVGIAPLFTAVHDGRAALLLVGSIEISDYLDLIVRPADLQPFLAGVFDFLQEQPSLRHVPIDFYNMPDASPTLPALKSEFGSRGWAYSEEIYRPAPHIPLHGDFEEYLDGLAKKQRHEIRRKMRRVSESLLSVEFELITEPTQLGTGIEAFLELMAHDADKAEFLKPAMRDHMRSVMRTAHEGGYLWLAFLNVDGARAAAALNFDYANKLWGYNSGVSRDFKEISPGWVLLTYQIRWALEHGRREFDFMRGDEEYKYRFGAINRHVMRVRGGPA